MFAGFLPLHRNAELLAKIKLPTLTSITILFKRRNDFTNVRFDFTNISLLVLKRGKKYIIILLIPNKKDGAAYQVEKIISKNQ